jgi:hypothetical protein
MGLMMYHFSGIDIDEISEIEKKDDRIAAINTAIDKRNDLTVEEKTVLKAKIGNNCTILNEIE